MRLARLRNHLDNAPLRYEDGATPPSADDVERAREMLNVAGVTCRYSCKPVCSNCYKRSPGFEGKINQIICALTTAREQGEAKGRAEAYAQYLKDHLDLVEVMYREREAAKAAAFEKGRAEGARQIKERAAKVASEALGGYLCPYGRDKKGDPTWDHTDKDNCPVCGVNGEDALFVCHDTYSGRIAAAIRALPEDENAEKGQA